MTTAQHRATRQPSGDRSEDDVRMVGTIDRRILCNYRVDPAAIRRLLPDGLRPHVRHGAAIAGVCLIRTTGLRPVWAPRGIAWRGENAAHRIAVEWDGPDGLRTGVYIPERYSTSWIPVALGGRIVPGVHRHARFEVEEELDRYRVSFEAAGAASGAAAGAGGAAAWSGGAAAEVDVDVELAPESTWRSELFGSVDDASDHFRRASIGWSPRRGRRGGPLEGLELRSGAWRVLPAVAHRVRSSFIDELPRDSAEFDDVLLMRHVPITWAMPRWETAGPTV